MRNRIVEGFLIASLILVVSVAWCGTSIGQNFPNKPITIYCGFVAGATTDLTARAIASGAERLLKVPVVVENKPGGSATVCAALIAGRKPDGYSLAALGSDAITRLPHLIKVSYNPMKDFTFIGQYARYIAGLCVLSDSPIKTIDDFIAYAKAHPDMTYGSSGINSHQGMGIELFAKCKGLQLKHIPYKGGAEAVTAFLGKHTDFICGTGSHIPYVKQGVARLLFVHMTNKRDPNFPNVPTLKELGCEDVPANTITIVAPKGMPDAVADKIADTFRKVSEGQEFQKMLDQINLPYDFKTRQQLNKDFPAEFEWWKVRLKEMGAKKEI
ncbi:MAG TPA: tripartite tricarboxylate transporter substrate binding protein [Thermodesulfobacteriota bacterium]|nr:tripartite tricarboxylate transporter substrate binding protein [Thermodesulfobacteriota bacterium]